MSDNTPAGRVARLGNLSTSDGVKGYASAVMHIYATEPVGQFYSDLSAILAQREALLKTAAEILEMSRQAVRNNGGIVTTRRCEDIHDAAMVAIALATGEGA